MSAASIFHPDAGKRFDERATALRERFEGGPPGPVTEASPLHSGVYVSASFGPNDIIGAVINTFTDKNGTEIGRVVTRDGATIGLRGDAHVEFLALAEAIQKTLTFRRAVAVSTVREWLWTWLIATEERALTTWLGERVAAAVVPQRILIPVFELFLPGTIRLGGVRLVTVSSELLDELDAFETANTPSAMQTDRLPAFQERRRKDLQGKAAALVEINAERQYAREYALDQTEMALAVLRLASRGVAIARGRSYCTVRGAEVVQVRTTLSLEGNALRPDRSWIASPLPQQWALEPQILTQAILPLLQPWFMLIERDSERTPFQDAVLKSTFIFSRATLQETLAEKILHAFTAMESVLLRNDSEPIGVSLGDRMAFLAESTADGRREKAKLVRTVYGYRSRFVHHAEDVGARPDELARIEQFMVHAMLSLRALAFKSLEGGVREACLDELDGLKYQ